MIYDTNVLLNALPLNGWESIVDSFLVEVEGEADNRTVNISERLFNAMVLALASRFSAGRLEEKWPCREALELHIRAVCGLDEIKSCILADILRSLHDKKAQFFLWKEMSDSTEDEFRQLINNHWFEIPERLILQAQAEYNEQLANVTTEASLMGATLNALMGNKCELITCENGGPEVNTDGMLAVVSDIVGEAAIMQLEAHDNHCDCGINFSPPEPAIEKGIWEAGSAGRRAIEEMLRLRRGDIFGMLDDMLNKFYQEYSGDEGDGDG